MSPLKTDSHFPARRPIERSDILIAPTINYGDVPSRATPEWGREMLEAMTDYITDFAREFGRTQLPIHQE